MSTTDPKPPDDIISAMEKICEERGAKAGVSPAYYQWFFNMKDEAMTELIRLLVLARADDINRLAFSKDR